SRACVVGSIGFVCAVSTGAPFKRDSSTSFARRPMTLGVGKAEGFPPIAGELCVGLGAVGESCACAIPAQATQHEISSSLAISIAVAPSNPLINQRGRRDLVPRRRALGRRIGSQSESLAEESEIAAPSVLGRRLAVALVAEILEGVAGAVIG